MIIKQVPLPCDIKELGVEGVNKIWRDARLKGVGIKRVTTLVTVAEHGIGNIEAPKSARKESQNLLNDYEVYKKRMEELMEEIEGILSEIPYVDKLLEISGGGIKTLNCFIAEVGDIGRLIIQNSCRSWPDMQSLQTALENITVIQQTRNEPVVGRNIFHRAGPCKGADLTP